MSDTTETSRGTTRGSSRTASRPRRTTRPAGVLAAVGAATAGWAAIEFGLGIDLRHPGGDIGAMAVVLASGASSLAGWGLLAVLERFTARAGRWWASVAVVFATASLIPPLTTPGIEVTGRAGLALLHALVAAVLIPLLYRTAIDRTGPR